MTAQTPSVQVDAWEAMNKQYVLPCRPTSFDYVFLADMRRQPGGERAMDALFRSAEGYLRMWERAEASNTLGR